MPEPDISPNPWRRRIQALLAKAQSTEYPAEADVLLAKAQQLMTRHAIDEAMLSSAGGGDEIGSERVVVDPPYAGARSSLLGVIGTANGCRVIVSADGRGGQTCVLVGSDAAAPSSMAMFAALSIYATRQMLASMVPATDTVRRFRHAFLLAFAVRISELLEAAARSVEREMQTEGGHSVALALADRSRAVDAAVAAEFPKLRRVTRQASSGAGIRSGRAAAERAELGRGISGTGPRSLHAG